MPSAFALLVLAGVLAAASPWPAAAAVYRCDHEGEGPLYTDQPCPFGMRVELPAEVIRPLRSAAADLQVPLPASAPRPGAAPVPPQDPRQSEEVERFGWSPSATLRPWPPRGAAPPGAQGAAAQGPGARGRQGPTPAAEPAPRVLLPNR